MTFHKKKKSKIWNNIWHKWAFISSQLRTKKKHWKKNQQSRHNWRSAPLGVSSSDIAANIVNEKKPVFARATKNQHKIRMTEHKEISIFIHKKLMFSLSIFTSFSFSLFVNGINGTKNNNDDWTFHEWNFFL